MKEAKFNILIHAIDDSDDDLYLITHAIKELKLPNELITHTDPINYLNTLNGDVHVLILDHRLGKMDGLEVLRQVRAKNPRVFVILLTAYGDETVTDEYVNIGIEKIIRKRGDFTVQLQQYVQAGLDIAAERIYYMNLFIQSGAKP